MAQSRTVRLSAAPTSPSTCDERATVVPDDELRLRHLDTIQSIINRLSQSSFTIRGWSVTVVTLVFALVGGQGDLRHDLVLITLVPALLFWGMDGYYMRQERRFRSLYGAAARRLRDGDQAPDVPPFDMDVEVWSGPATRTWRVLFTPSVAAIPCMLVTVVVAYWRLAS